MRDLTTLRQDNDQACLSVEEEKKVLCQLLGKLYVPDTVDDDQIRTLKLLMHNVRLVRAFLFVLDIICCMLMCND